MDTQPKLIYRAERTHLLTSFPVYYFGTSNAKVYVVYLKLYGNANILTVAILDEFSYNYKEERLFYRHRPVLIPESILNGKEGMKDIMATNFSRDRLTEIIAKSFLNEALSSKQPINKLGYPGASEDKE
jgi:hypothetical protein